MGINWLQIDDPRLNVLHLHAEIFSKRRKIFPGLGTSVCYPPKKHHHALVMPAQPDLDECRCKYTTQKASKRAPVYNGAHRT